MAPENPLTMHSLLKKQTMELHAQAHNIPYIFNLLQNNLPIESYTGYLNSLAIIYGTLENQIETFKKLNLKEFLPDYSLKLPLILADLEFLKADQQKVILPAISHALHIADKIILYSESCPYKLLGFVYTLDGSLNGGNILKKRVSETFALQNNDGIRYFSSFDADFERFWKNFLDILNTKFHEPSQQEDIISAAQEIFLDLMEIYKSLYPFDEKSFVNHVTALNPEAGNYPISSNPLEIQAAIKAGMNCWNEFPYYEIRYGDRGRRFTVSDSAWLVTLCELSQEDVLRQIDWLAKFLSVRGMPTYTMEIQMQQLYKELTDSIPSNEQKYHRLLNIAEILKDRRKIHISESLFETCNSVFEKHFLKLNVSEKKFTDLKKNIGKLIASSIIDNKNGISDDRSLEKWLKSKEHFPDNWITAVEKALMEIELLIV